MVAGTHSNAHTIYLIIKPFVCQAVGAYHQIYRQETFDAGATVNVPGCRWHWPVALCGSSFAVVFHRQQFGGRVMKIFAAILCLATSAAWGQADPNNAYYSAYSQQIGSNTYGSSSNGTSWQTQRIGSSTYGSASDGYNWQTQRIGSSTYGSGSDGNSWTTQRIGTTTYGTGTDGSSWQTQQVGKTLYYSDSQGNSRSCQQVGDQVYC
jgi:hypothetical protein